MYGIFVRTPIILISFALSVSCQGNGGKSKPADAAPVDTSSGPDTENSDECDEVDFDLSGKPPTFMIVLDRSGSMNQGDPSMWEIVTDGLKTVTSQMDHQIRFAMLLFPEGVWGLCAPPPIDPEVPLADLTSNAIAEVLTEEGPLGGGTPTTRALQNAYSYLVNNWDDESPPFVLLATYGAPNCSDDPTLTCETCTPSIIGDTCNDDFICLDDQATYAKVIEYYDNWGIVTYVVGVGEVVDEWDDVMNNIAYHGGTSEYYPAQDPETLVEALQAIAAANTECTFDVEWSSLAEGASSDPLLVNVYADGDVLPYSPDCTDPGGWRWLDADTIELCTDVCHNYRWGVISEIGATFGCDTIIE